MKSTLEWMSFNLHPFEKQTCNDYGASHYDQGTSRAQVHLRKSWTQGKPMYCQGRIPIRRRSV